MLLKNRKNTTENAVKQALDFFQNFDLSAAADVKSLVSEDFPCTFDSTGHNDYASEACFKNKRGILKLYCLQTGKTYALDYVFDKTCTHVNFTKMMQVFESFIQNLNALIDEKETELADFLNFLEEYKQNNCLDPDTLRAAQEFEANTEVL